MSGANSNIAVTISAVDRVSKEIAAIKKQIASMQTPAERAGRGLKNLTNADRVGKMASGMRGMARDSFSAFQSVSHLLPAMEALTGAATIAGLAALSREWARMGNQMGNSAQRAGTGVAQLSNFQNAAKLSGASAQAATSGLTSLNDAITNAAAGRSPQAIMAFNQLGMSMKDLRDSNGHLKSTADLLPQIAHGLAGIHNPTIQHEVGDMLFGGSADELMPLFRRYDELTQQASKTGADWTDKMTADASQMNKAWERLGENFTGISNHIADDWSGTGTKVMTVISDWIEKNEKLAESYAKVGAGITALGLLKLSAPVLRMLGLGALGDATAPLAVAGVAAGASYKNGQDSASAQATAASQGYTQVASADDMGMPTAFTNPTTGDTRSAMQFDPRYNPSGALPVAGPTRTVPLGSGQERTNVRDMSAELAKQGYTREGIAALLGSGVQESGLNPLAVQGGGAHRGIFQWSQERQAAIQKQFGKTVSDMSPTEQADAAAWELNNNPAYAGLNKQLKSSHDLAANNQGVTTTFEAPGNYGTEVPNRLALSQGVLASMPDAATSPGIAGGAGASPAASETTVRGSANVNVRLSGFPDGTTTSATTDGDLFANAGPVKVQQSSVGSGMSP